MNQSIDSSMGGSIPPHPGGGHRRGSGSRTKGVPPAGGPEGREREEGRRSATGGDIRCFGPGRASALGRAVQETRRDRMRKQFEPSGGNTRRGHSRWIRGRQEDKDGEEGRRPRCGPRPWGAPWPGARTTEGRWGWACVLNDICLNGWLSCCMDRGERTENRSNGTEVTGVQPVTTGLGGDVLGNRIETREDRTHLRGEYGKE